MSTGSPEQVTDVLTQWLEQEIVNADEGRNAYLSDYEDRRNDLFKPFSEPSNFQAQKAKGHYDRFIQWVAPYKEADLRTSDWFAARITFACLMSVSGSYRKQCFFEAEDEGDYLRQRYESPIGIDIGSIVANELDPEKVANVGSMGEDERLDYIIERSLKTNDESLDLHSLIHTWAIDHKKPEGQLATPEDEPVVAMQEAQKLWTGLAAAHIVVAATLRDNDYARVPFLEPKSITDVTQVMYPLAA
jgi:hypothetical protein